MYILLFLCCVQYTAAISDSARTLVENWAPKIWLHPEEPFYPSSVEFHLQNIQVNDEVEHLRQYNPTISSILTGPITSSYHLNTKEDVECVNCFQNFFSGQSLAESPVYTFVTEHNDDCETVDVSYALFFPFNYGKDVCIGIEDGNGGCIGDKRTFGNHIGDWEHFSLRFQRGEPKEAYVSVHSFGAWYDWKSDENRFVFTRGENTKRFKRSYRTQDREGKSLGLRLGVEYPQYIDLDEGRPTVYAALGSHGLWSQPGKHNYLHILTIHLDDFCEKGEAWNSWQNLKIYETGDLDSFTGNDSWINFRGRWGNIKKLECELELVSGECGLVGGPTGPFKYFQHDFVQPPPC